MCQFSSFFPLFMNYSIPLFRPCSIGYAIRLYLVTDMLSVRIMSPLIKTPGQHDTSTNAP